MKIIPFTVNVSNHIESSQLICNTNHMTDFQMTENIGRNMLTDLIKDNEKKFHSMMYNKNPLKESPISIFSIWLQKFGYHFTFDKFGFDQGKLTCDNKLTNRPPLCTRPRPGPGPKKKFKPLISDLQRNLTSTIRLSKMIDNN